MGPAGPKEGLLRALREARARRDQETMVRLARPAPPATKPAAPAAAPAVARKETATMISKVTNPPALQAKPKAKPVSNATKKLARKMAAELEQDLKATAAKSKAKAKKAARGRKGVPAIDVARFMARPADGTKGFAGGASMAELTKKFGIESHPMRAKIFYVRHTLGWKVDTLDGRYFATEPKAKT